MPGDVRVDPVIAPRRARPYASGAAPSELDRPLRDPSQRIARGRAILLARTPARSTAAPGYAGTDRARTTNRTVRRSRARIAGLSRDRVAATRAAGTQPQRLAVARLAADSRTPSTLRLRPASGMLNSWPPPAPVPPRSSRAGLPACRRRRPRPPPLGVLRRPAPAVQALAAQADLAVRRRRRAGPSPRPRRRP